MALSASLVWEVRTVSSNTNGGGYKPGASGTDWSQQNNAQYALTNGVTNGTTTIATVSAATDMVGNTVYVTGGTGSITAGWYEITAASAGVSITVDRSTGLTTGTGVTLNVGGALASIYTATNLASVADNIIYVKATATYVENTTINILDGVSIVTSLIGYNSTRTDGGQATIQRTSGTTELIRYASSGNNVSIQNIIGDCNALANIACYLGNNATVINCDFKKWTSYGLITGNASLVLGSVSQQGTGANQAFYTAGQSLIAYCIAHDNASADGFLNDSAMNTIINCIADTNGGCGFISKGGQSRYVNCISYASGLDGFKYNGGNALIGGLFNCIAVSNSGYGVNSANLYANAQSRYNVFYSNTSGARNNFPVGATDVTITGDPFTNSAAGDFTLNNTAGAGAACRAAGFPGVFPSGAGTGYLDIGAIQHQDSGGGGITQFSAVF